MTNVKIQGAEHQIKEIFSDRFVFEIPPYQRPYSWTQEQAGELLEDLLGSMQNGQPTDPDPYFLGSIVLAKSDKDPRSKVIDGQQRLTTLTILFAALAAHASGGEREEIRDFILQKGSRLRGTKTVYRVTLRERDARFFSEYVQAPDGFRKLLALDPGPLSDPHRNVQGNAQLFFDRLGGLRATDRSALSAYLLNHCFLVAVSTPDRDSAFRIFAILNDRGLDLSHADIIKSEIIGEIPDDQQERYTKVWEDAEEELGIEQFADLFSHIRMIYAKSKQRGNLLKEFREYVLKEVSDPVSFIDDVVSPFADIYARLCTHSWESAVAAEEINRSLEWLGKIDNFDWVPPAIRYVHGHRQSPRQIARYLAGLERLAANMFVSRLGINARIERYGKVLQEIDDGVDVLERGTALDLTEEEKARTREALAGELYRNPRTRLFVLLRLDALLSAGGVLYDHGVITVEHVLPQTPSEDSEWMQLFSAEERDFWTHRVANLVLLPRRKNSAAQNYGFAMKKEKYFSGPSGTSPFVLTTQVLEHAEWTPDILRRRQSEILERIFALWDLKPIAEAGRAGGTT